MNKNIRFCILMVARNWKGQDTAKKIHFVPLIRICNVAKGLYDEFNSFIVINVKKWAHSTQSERERIYYSNGLLLPVFQRIRTW